MSLTAFSQKDGGVEGLSIAIVEDLHDAVALRESTDCVYKFLGYLAHRNQIV